MNSGTVFNFSVSYHCVLLLPKEVLFTNYDPVDAMTSVYQKYKTFSTVPSQECVTPEKCKVLFRLSERICSNLLWRMEE